MCAGHFLRRCRPRGNLLPMATAFRKGGCNFKCSAQKKPHEKRPGGGRGGAEQVSEHCRPSEPGGRSALDASAEYRGEGRVGAQGGRARAKGDVGPQEARADRVRGASRAAGRRQQVPGAGERATGLQSGYCLSPSLLEAEPCLPSSPVPSSRERP